MTVKSFVKTAILGIAFCSVFGINNSTAMDNNRNNHINNYRFNLKKFLKQLLEFEKTTINNGSKIDFNVDISKQLFEKYEQIKEIIQKAIDHVVNQNDITLLNDNIEYLERNKTASTHLHKEREFILNNSRTIKYKVQQELNLDLNKILKIIKNDMYQDINRTLRGFEHDKPIVFFDENCIWPKIKEILTIIENTVVTNNINQSDYNILCDNLQFLIKSELGVKYKSGKGSRISIYGYIINTINEYSNRIKIEAKKYLNHKKLKDEGWEIIEK